MSNVHKHCLHVVCLSVLHQYVCPEYPRQQTLVREEQTTADDDDSYSQRQLLRILITCSRPVTATVVNMQTCV